MKAISSYRVNGEYVYVKTPYCKEIVDECRSFGGSFVDGEWKLPGVRLVDVEERIGRCQSDLVQVDWLAHIEDDGPQVRIGWHVVASRRHRDSWPVLYAEVSDGELEKSGGSMKNPRVACHGVTFRIWVPRDFSVERDLTIVKDPREDAVADVRQQAIDEARTIMAQHGLTVEDLR